MVPVAPGTYSPDRTASARPPRWGRFFWDGGWRGRSGAVAIERGRQLRRPYSSQTRSPQSHSNARMTVCLSGKCTVLINFSVAPQTRHSRLELPSVSPIFSALNISIGHPRVLMPEFREKMVIVKLGHCKNQTRPLRVETGQYPLGNGNRTEIQNVRRTRRRWHPGEGFMAFGVAMARLKAALIPMLQSGKPISGVFDEVFK
jgi:hypothetical protein